MSAPPNGSLPTRSLERALYLLEAFDSDITEATLSELAARTGLAVSTAARLLSTLEGRGFLRRFPDGRFALGPVVMRLGLRAANISVREVAGPHLRYLAEQTRESANLGIRDDDDRVLYIECAPSPQALRVTNWVGRRIPGKGAAIGAALDGAVESCGYAIRRDTVESHITAVAAPIRQKNKGIVAAINIVGPTARIPDAQLAAFGALIVREAARISNELGDDH